MSRGIPSRRRLIDAVERHLTDDRPGFCIACGKEVKDIAPDLHGLACDYCGAFDSVAGAEYLLNSLE